MNEGLIIVCIILAYYFLGGIINGIMHRFFPETFTNDSDHVTMTVMAWIVIVPIFLFALYCDRCIVWFEKKKK
jgi:glucan phosphoethanolaminetransferase (alkaline phosphatase superfamily)